MKRVCTLVLISIIVLSKIVSWLSHIHKSDPFIIVDTVKGVVSAGNFSTWQMGYIGPLRLELTSVTGDADLYVADNIRPTYETDGHNMSAITCGVDVVHIPANFPRPVGIGVFGHWSHTSSEFCLRVYLDSEWSSTVQIEPNNVKFLQKKDNAGSADTQTYKSAKKEEGRSHLLRLLSVLDTVFEMLVL